MENATKRIRKARRQGLARGKDLAPTPKVSFRGTGATGSDNPATPSPRGRKDLVGQRKSKRQARSTAAPRAR
jgi:hypothetical protein